MAAALEGRPAVAHPGNLSAGKPPGAAPRERVDLFAQVFQRGGGEVVLLADLAAARAWLAEFATAFGSAAVSPDVPAALRPDLPVAAPDTAELGVSVATCAAAFTGSLVLESGHGRALQLLPPVHLVWLPAAVVFSGLEEALDHARAAGNLPAVVALHSGPSRSADIGQIVVRGVHGPGRVVAAVLETSRLGA